MPLDHFSALAGIYHRLADYCPTETMFRLGNLPADGLLLDVGGGTGRVARSLRGQARRVIVVDLSAAMLRHAAGAGLPCVRAPGEALPFATATFARVIMVDVLHHVDSQACVVQEAWRILQPGGRLLIVEPDIRRCAVKLVALLEKLALMRSHFLPTESILSLLRACGAQGMVEYEGASAWIAALKS